MKLKRFLAVVCVSAATVASAACTHAASTNADDQLNAEQNADTQQFVFVQPLPRFPFSRIRQNAIEAEAINAFGINSTTFFFVQGIDHPIYQCASVGVPVPVTDALSPSIVPVWNGRGGINNKNYSDAGAEEDQMEPDGVFHGDSTGTDSLCVFKTGQEFMGYNEAYDVSFTAKAHWDPNALGAGKGQIVVDGAPVIPICTVKVLNASKHQAEEVCTDPTNANNKTIAPAPSPTSS